ncbi:uncharacterized protein BDR25DRAFT_218081 [Lindgomyces ingoldianus]|uniref:Uncharacterized protein n=1 Tax=Lindgomyces ingoldianus TaxID=673940 RepID=A0ACB6R3E1_9PLEO|nr:uncharacterized protein BDR25DRAFT_218081 [Lindgomyces ingoldianus]KAF2473305.1 hypothetical protein BDR25DRAFT_218081 [Lindgomyces ingoldianus]
MANLAHSRLVVADLGGKRLQDHKLVYESPAGIRNSDQRSPSPEDARQKSTNHTGGRGSGQSTSEETTNEDDDEDSSANQEDDQEDDDDPEVLAPSHGIGLGKGKRPAIRIDHAGRDESPEGAEETASRVAGHKASKHLVNQVLMHNKKRTLSSVSNTSVLFGEDDDLTAEQHAFPRSKIPRKLNNCSDTKDFVMYKKNTDPTGTNGLDNAIESSDDEGQQEQTINVDDEDYSGVNLISDESDMENLEEQEETFIINEEKQHATDLFGGPRRADFDSFGGGDFLECAAVFQTHEYPDIGFGQFFNTEPLPTSSIPGPARKYSDSSTKRVRFEDEVDESDSSSSSSELDSSLWPDLFMEQNKLPPSLYKLIENDHESDMGEFPSSGSDHSYWDVGQDEGRSLPLHDPKEFDDDSSEPGSSGYETDMGDTTDEDTDFIPDCHQLTPGKKSVLHRPSSAPGSKAASPKPFERSAKPGPAGRAIPPLRGIFIHDESSQAIAVTNRATKKVTFYRPRASISLHQPNFGTTFGVYDSTSSTANNSPRTSLQQFNADDSDLSNEMFSTAFQGSTDIMLTGIFGGDPADGFGSSFSGTFGPPQAFYPFVSIGQNGNITTDDLDEYYDDDEDDEDDIDIADFMNFGDDGDATDADADGEEEPRIPGTPATSMIALNGSTPAQPTPLTETPLNRKRNASDAMLEHFDRGVVTAFRNNQNRYRDISCLPHDPDLRASESRPLRSGRSAETLISPLRKRSSLSRRSRNLGFAGITKATGKLQSTVMEPRRGPRLGTFS